MRPSPRRSKAVKPLPQPEGRELSEAGSSQPACSHSRRTQKNPSTAVATRLGQERVSGFDGSWRFGTSGRVPCSNLAQGAWKALIGGHLLPEDRLDPRVSGALFQQMLNVPAAPEVVEQRGIDVVGVMLFRGSIVVNNIGADTAFLSARPGSRNRYPTNAPATCRHAAFQQLLWH